MSRVKRCSYSRGPLLPGTCHLGFVGRCPLGAKAEHIPQGIAAHGDTVVQSAQERGKESLPPDLAPASRKGTPFLFFLLLSLTPLPFLLPSIVSLPSLALAYSSPSISLFSFFPPVLPQLLCFPLVLPYLSSRFSFTHLLPLRLLLEFKRPLLPSWSKKSSYTLQGVGAVFSACCRSPPEDWASTGGPALGLQTGQRPLEVSLGIAASCLQDSTPCWYPLPRHPEGPTGLGVHMSI